MTRIRIRIRILLVNVRIIRFMLKILTRMIIDHDTCCPSSSSVSVSSMVMIGRELPSPPVKPPQVTSSTPPYLVEEKMRPNNNESFHGFTLPQAR